jgi:heat shock protein HslJ
MVSPKIQFNKEIPMQTQKVLASFVVVIAMILSACTATNTSATPLNNTGWILVSLNGQLVLSDPQVTINFENGKINGTDGCNSYGSSYTVKGSKFNVHQDIVTTMMACPNPIMQQAAAYITILTQSASYKIDGQQLTLLDASGKALATFTKQSRDLGGTAWTVTGYNNGKQAVVSVITGTELTADFSADGKLNGSAGCNNNTATYAVSGKSIQIGPAASTRKCAPIHSG